MTKKKSPQDLTSRNNTARKKEIAELRKELERVSTIVSVLQRALGWDKYGEGIQLGNVMFAVELTDSERKILER